MEETYTLTEFEEREILESCAEIERGEFLTLDELWALLQDDPSQD